MATFKLSSLSRVETLKRIRPDRLIAVLEPHREYFRARGYELEQQDQASKINYDELIKIFMTPVDPVVKAPQELVNDLCVLDEMATPDGMDSLLQASKTAGITLERSADDTPIDVVIQIWLVNRDIVEEKHAEQKLWTPRSFEYFSRIRGPVPQFTMPSKKTLQAMRTSLDEWFYDNRRERGSRIFPFERDEIVWFLVRHKQPLRREPSAVGNKSTTVTYWPECYDVVVYDQHLGELRIHASSKGEKRLYCETFGQHLFMNKHFFGAAGKYTLDPLRINGVNSLCCDDIDGIEWVKLREIHFLWGGSQGEIEIRKADDIFAAYAASNRSMPATQKIPKATFEVKFSDSKRTRKVTIHVPCRTNCVRDEDSTLFDRWLTARGFIIADKPADDSQKN